MQLQRLLNFVPVVFLATSVPAFGQSFSSGSTGADGALDLTNGSQTVQVPPSGVFNYTTVNIPQGQTLSFINNLTNTPVTMLAQGAVSIAGTINISAPAGASTPGPGGFDGGNGGDPATPGWGPGGGATYPLGNGQWVGPLSLFPNIGGSGGAGNATYGCLGRFSLNGGGGGGAVTIASSTSINIASSGAINASGATFTATDTCGNIWTGTSGAPGAVRLVANSVSVAGTVTASVFRMEAPTGSAPYSGSGTAPVIAPINPDIVPTKPPSLQIVSVGGYPVPPGSGSSFSTIDVLLPSQLQDPIPVVVKATNVPVGSPVTINFNNSPSATFPPVNLSGTKASSTATVNVSGLSRSGIVYLFVSATFNASLIADDLDPAGVSKIEVASALGRQTHYRFLRRDGAEVPPAKLPYELKAIFGL